MFKLKKLWCLIVLLLYAVTLIEILTVFVPDKLFSLSLTLSLSLFSVVSCFVLVACSVATSLTTVYTKV